MFERFRKGNDGGGVATASREQTAVREPAADEGRFTRDGEAVSGREAAREVRARQRAAYGGLNWGSAFFGWLVAVGMAAILLGLLSAAGAAFGLGDVSDSQARANADTIGIVGGILLILVLVIAYYCGGYVSGRMSRFDPSSTVCRHTERSQPRVQSAIGAPWRGRCRVSTLLRAIRPDRAR